MKFIENFNKLHYLLTQNFKDVSVLEKTNLRLGNYIEISVKENYECKIIIKKKDIDSTTFNWEYLSNPLNESEGTVSRTSTIDNFVDNLKDIFNNRRFSRDYVLNSKINS